VHQAGASAVLVQRFVSLLLAPVSVHPQRKQPAAISTSVQPANKLVSRRRWACKMCMCRSLKYGGCC
jgi:hypothetical protein